MSRETLRVDAEAIAAELKLVAAVIADTLQTGNESTRLMRAASEIITRLLVYPDYLTVRDVVEARDRWHTKADNLALALLPFVDSECGDKWIWPDSAKQTALTNAKWALVEYNPCQFERLKRG